jgi:uncharacterized protein YaeQ
MAELRSEKIHRAKEIEIYSFSADFLDELSLLIKRDNRWGVLFNDGRISIQVGEISISNELTSHKY